MSVPQLSELTRVFARIGILSFGGPAAQIALMHRELVEERKWLSEETFLRALSLCMMLPGPEAMQLATYAGWRMRGTTGGLIAGTLFVLPGAIIISVLVLLYAAFGDLPVVQAGFAGIKATVIVIVLQALMRLSGKSLTNTAARLLAAISFVAVFVFGLPFPLIVALAAAYGALFMTCKTSGDQGSATQNAHPLRTLSIWLSLWLAPIAVIAISGQLFLFDVAIFFSKLAVVTFGGAYAVLAYMTQAIVSDYGWITTVQMIDALGLAETTPGPLILVTQFVAMLAGFAQGGVTLSVLAGITALWVTFTPCFLWIFLAGPYLDQIAARPRLSAALDGITAAVVGVILNLALWFAIHFLFDTVRSVSDLALPFPEWNSLNFDALILTGLAGILLLPLKRGLFGTLWVMALAGVIVDAVI